MRSDPGSIPVHFDLLDRYIEELVRQAKAGALHLPRRNKGDIVNDLLGTLHDLRPDLAGPTAHRARYHEWVRRGRVEWFALDEATSLLEAIHGQLPADYQKRLGAWLPAGSDVRELPSGNATRGEIEIIRRSPGGNLVQPEHTPVDKFVSVYVDEVRFRQVDRRDGQVKVLDGRYVRIEVPGDPPGAVVLPVDPETGDVLLVTQYRHPQRCWLTEAPRGFGVVEIDRDAAATARRELNEETGARPRVLPTGEQLFPLRSLYTDTGKLLERPVYFLAYVDRELAVDRLLRLGPVMEDPVWVKLECFLAAVHSEEGVRVREGHDFDFALPDEDRSRFFARSDLDEGRLRIADAFTVTAALLALPRLARRFQGHPAVSPHCFDLQRYG
jgi:8-oxo-dGTP pyrophosphatase MutT (NUDIX family)